MCTATKARFTDMSSENNELNVQENKHIKKQAKSQAERSKDWYEKNKDHANKRRIDRRIREGTIPTMVAMERYNITLEYINHRRAEAQPPLPPIIIDEQLTEARGMNLKGRKGDRNAVFVKPVPVYELVPESPRFTTPSIKNNAQTEDKKSRPLVLVLIGLPGSGKSTLSEAICQSDPETWVRVNQDTLGSRFACENAVNRALASGKSVIVDRTNTNQSQRSIWVNIARTHGARTAALVLKMPIELCIKRAETRKGHPTLKNLDARDVINRFDGMYEQVNHYEGFEDVWVCYTPAKADEASIQIASLQWPSN